MKINRVGVIGSGVMGVGVAHDFAQFGIPVVLIDISEEILKTAEKEIEKNIRFQRLMGKSGASIDETIKNIRFSTDYHELGDVDFVIENVPEKLDIKKTVYEKLDSICSKESIFAANTSAISITKIGSFTKRPENVLGIHFMNPVPLKKTVEVIKGFHTNKETLDTAVSLMEKVEKKSVIVNDMPGFVSNRVLMLTINEAVFLIQDQVASPEDVDTIFRECFGHKMGPLETADLIGLDTILYSLDVLYESYNDPKFRPSPLLVKMVDAGLHGRKNGRGFFTYQF